MHYGNYNPSCKAKSNMQEDSYGPMTRARAKQLQRALTSQIGMIEAASELKLAINLKLVQGCLFAKKRRHQTSISFGKSCFHDMGKAITTSRKIGLTNTD